MFTLLLWSSLKRLSIENKLPKVAYATAFDQYSMFCQLAVITILVGPDPTQLVFPSVS